MVIVAFAGPSLTATDRASFAEVEWRPPAEAGDLLRLPPDPSLTICLIDGYFDHRPAVRHKEILLRLSEGVRILGASSIGALRAAEMDRFGLTGVGAIYRAYRDGRLTGDDEVALVHGPAEWDWRPLSLPLVDVRAALGWARRRRILSRAEARALLDAAVAIFYADREWETILDRAALPKPSRLTFAQFARSAPSLKRLDAIACLKAARRAPAGRAPRPEAVWTCFLTELVRQCQAGGEAGPRSSGGIPARTDCGKRSTGADVPE